jgi:hypothetical protein
MNLLTQIAPTPRPVITASGRDRRQYDRLSLDGAQGELAYRGIAFPCDIIDISIGGCCIRTERRFPAGALANVEVVLPLFGMTLRIVGVTQWLDQRNQIGIRFILPSAKSKNQLASLITCIIDKDALEEVQEAMTSSTLHEMPGLAVSVPLSLVKKHPVLAEIPAEEIVFSAMDQSIHGGERWVRPAIPGDWKAVFRNPATVLQFNAGLVDLSSQGCNLRCSEPCEEVANANVELEFEIRGLHFQLSGVVAAIYSTRTCGIRFSPMTTRKKDALVQLIEELDAASSLSSAPPQVSQTEAPVPVGRVEKEESPADEKGKKKHFWSH